MIKKSRKVRIKEALQELQNIIKKKYPNAIFSIGRGREWGSYTLEVIVDIDVDDTDKVFDLVVSRLVDMQVEKKLPVSVHVQSTPEKERHAAEEYVNRMHALYEASKHSLFTS